MLIELLKNENTFSIQSLRSVVLDELVSISESQYAETRERKQQADEGGKFLSNLIKQTILDKKYAKLQTKTTLDRLTDCSAGVKGYFLRNP